jgi:phosphohistidine phosphatase
MRLLVVRHGIAEDRDAWAQTGVSDALRPLTPRGRRRMRRCARGLARLVGKLDALATSPLVRARQTAEVVADAFGGLEIDEVPALAPGETPEAVAAWVRRAGREHTIAVIGHEPELGILVSWCLAGRGAFVPLRKGGACLLELSSTEPGGATLVWSLAPRHLRALGR